MLLLTNAKVITLDDQNTIANSILIEHGTIMAVGTQSDFTGLPKELTKVDLDGATIIPGFTDSHIHLLLYGQALSNIDCDTSSRKECLERVSLATRSNNAGTWIRGHGWNNNKWIENRIHKDVLDDIALEHPVFLSNKSLHGAWVNSKALAICEINENTPDPEGGRIGRDENGSPNGILYESAVSLVTDIFPEISDQEAVKLIDNAQKQLFQHGITTVHDFDRITSFKALQELDRNYLLKLRVAKSLPVEAFDNAISIGLQSGFGSPHLTYRFIKLFMDGALSTQTASMLDPYENSSEVGMLLLQEDELMALAKKASRHHLQLAVHAIGDRANRVVIESFQKLRKWEKQNNLSGLHHRIEHLQTCQLEDIQKLRNLGVIASVQPIHLASDVPAAEKWLGERCIGTYAFKSISQSGIPLVFGSDAPVEVPDCLLGIHTAIHRTQRDNTPFNGWQPREKLSPLEALRGFTRTPHDHFPLNDAPLGRLSAGYKADLVVLNDFPLSAEGHYFKDLVVQKTMIDGRWVWES